MALKPLVTGHIEVTSKSKEGSIGECATHNCFGCCMSYSSQPVALVSHEGKQRPAAEEDCRLTTSNGVTTLS